MGRAYYHEVSLATPGKAFHLWQPVPVARAQKSLAEKWEIAKRIARRASQCVHVALSPGAHDPRGFPTPVGLRDEAEEKKRFALPIGQSGKNRSVFTPRLETYGRFGIYLGPFREELIH